ncbi:MAG TPA: hypothetical protein VGW34_04285 [Allosphingosinicella sp.]|nr:hypothetical protein [Allosphingosinicella sp.]
MAGDSVNIDGYEITLTDGVAGPRQIKIAGGPTSTGDRLRDHINQAAGSDANFPVTATNAAGVVTLTARKKGLSGNLVALSAAPKTQTSFRLGPWLSGGSFSPDNDRYYLETHEGTPQPPLDAETQVAPASAPSGSSGVWHYTPNLERISPTFFGLHSDSDFDHNRRLLQAAVRASSLHGYVVRINREWKVDRPVRLLDNAILEGTLTGDPAIVCVGNHNAPSPLRAGGWAGLLVPNADSELIVDPADDDPPRPYFEHIRWVDCTTTPGNAYRLEFAPPDRSALFPAGATVFVREKGYYFSAGQMPLFLMPNVVTASAPEAITLKRGISRPMTSPQVALATCPVSLRNGGAGLQKLIKGKVMPDIDGQRDNKWGGPISVVRNVRITGIGLASRPEPDPDPDPDRPEPPLLPPGTIFAPNTGLFECTIDVPWTEGRTAAAFNCLAYSSVRIGIAQVWEKGVEIALGGGRSSVHICTLNVVRHPANNVGAVVQLTENVYDTDVTITTLNVNSDYNPGSYIAVVRAATYCSLTIDAVIIFEAPQSPSASWSGAVLGILNEARDKTVDPHESQSRTDNITVDLKSVTGGRVERYIHMSNTGLLMRDITVTGKFDVERQTGTYPGEAIQLRGVNVSILTSSRMRSGMVDIRQTDGVSVNIESADPNSGFIEDSATINVVAKTIT